MCGLFGFSYLTDVTRAMAPFLAYEMEKRGTHSWGATDGYQIVKHLGPILNSFEMPDDWQQAIYHTRLASCGAITIDNQHPFSFSKADGTNVVGIHNGVVSNHEELCRLHNRDFDVDTMHIYAHLAAGLPVSEIRGYGALAWYEVRPSAPPVLHISKFNMYDLHVAALTTGEVVFCSERTPIERAVRWARTEVDTFYTLYDNHHYTVDNVANEVLEAAGIKVFQLSDHGATLPFGARHYGGGTVYSGTRYSEPWHGIPGATYTYKKPENCRSCHHTTGYDKRYLFCTSCYKNKRRFALDKIERDDQIDRALVVN